MQIFTNVEWTGTIIDMRFIIGCCTFAKGNLFSGKSKKHNVVLRGRAEFELRSVAHGVCKEFLIERMFTKLGLELQGPTSLYFDN